MRKVYHWIVYHPKLVITVFMAALIVSVLCQPLVAVNYDMNDYLPPGSASTLALNALGEEFEGGIPNARVMIRDVSIAGALAYKRQLEAIEGVSAVTWLDDVSDITTPLPMQDQDTLETYYRDRNALFTVTIEEEFILPAVDAIRELIGDENAMGGAAVNTAVATTSTTTEIRTIAIFAVIFVCFILALTTSSWMEPVIVMASLGTAILINMGTTSSSAKFPLSATLPGPSCSWPCPWTTPCSSSTATRTARPPSPTSARPWCPPCASPPCSSFPAA